jgi:hypothetical protein
MAITASGLYGPTLQKMLTNAAALDVSAEDLKVAMVTDSYTPDFDTHDFYADLTNEVTGTGYTAGGAALTGTTLTVASGLVTYDAADVVWGSSTIASAMAAVGYFDAVTDELLFLSDFVNAASSSAGTFTIQWSASGIWTIDISA